MKTYLVFDTNALKNGGNKYKDFNVFNVHSRVLNLINKIEKSDSLDSFEILVPKISMEELKQQQLEKYKETYVELNEKYNQLKNLSFIKLEETSRVDYSQKLDELIEQFIENNNIEILDVCSEDRFYKIVNRALRKRAPFRGGNGGDSDKGFKDALIWESLLEFSLTHSGKFVFITQDKDFFSKKDELLKEFSQETDSTIEFCKGEDLEKTPNIVDQSIDDIGLSQRLESVKEAFDNIKDTFYSELKDKCFSEFYAFGINFTNILVEFGKFVFYEESEGFWKLTLFGKVALDDEEMHTDLKLKLIFDVVVDEIIQKLELVDYSISLLSGNVVEDTNLNKFMLEFDNSIEEVNKVMEPMSKEPLKGRHDESTNVKGIIKTSDIEFILNKFQEEVYTSPNEIIDAIEVAASIDWYKFDNKISMVKTELKRLFRKNKESLIVIDSLTDEITEAAQKEYEECDQSLLEV